MTPLLSIVIPVFREPMAILRQLHHLRACSQIAECEIIVVDGDNGSTRTPTDILPLSVVDSPPGRGIQLDTGARCSHSPNLLFLHVDTVLPRRFVRLVTHALDHRAAGAFDLSIRSHHPIVRLISSFGLIRSRLTRLPYGDQAQFIRRELYERVGGYPPVPVMEDVALMDAVRRAGEKIEIVSAPARTSDRRWQVEGAVSSTLRNWRILLAYRNGVPPRKLAGRYRSQAELEREPVRLIIFHRALRREGLKTRLAADLGRDAAVDLYRACLTGLAREVARSAITPVWFVDDPAAGAAVHPDAIPQHGRTLFARMEDALERVFLTGAQRAILIGSDIPGLSSALLRQAAAGLENADAVLGPTQDGGYYLIGFCRSAYRPGLIDPHRIRESAQGEPERAGSETAERIRAAGLRLLSLPVLRDLDTALDLAAVLADRRIHAPALRSAVRRRRLDLSVY